jgi:hypothetical protein
MGGEQQGREVHAADGGSVPGGDSTVNNNSSLDGKQNRTALRGSRRWTRKQKIKVITVVASPIAVVATALIALIPSLTSGGNGGPGPSPGAINSPGASQSNFNIVNNGTNNGQIGGIINNVGSTVNGGGLSNDPQGFVNAIVNRNTSVVALYLESGLKATTLYKGASAILFGFQGVPQNGDPVALVKTFQAGGFKVDEELEDSHLMGALSDNLFPLQFDTNLTPKGYTGGYWGGWFVGSLLFWIVQRALGTTVTDPDIQVIKYLISQGADCKVPLSFMEFNSKLLSGQSGLSSYAWNELFPIIQSCTK